MTRATVGLVLLLCVWCAAPISAAPAPAENVGFLDPAADARQMATWCPAQGADRNLVLVVTLRGSGEIFGPDRRPHPDVNRNRLRLSWYPVLAKGLVAKGYRVAGLEIVYPALGLEAITDGRLLQFLLSAAGHGDSIAQQLRAAVDRCPTRSIVIGAYSQGGIALRVGINRLRTENRVLSQIADVTLVADAASDPRIDDGLRHPTRPGHGLLARSTSGAWAVSQLLSRRRLSPLGPAARTLFARANVGDPGVNHPYPSILRRRTYAYCAELDLVCDTAGFLAAGAEQLSRGTGAAVRFTKRSSATHSSYLFPNIGRAVVARIDPSVIGVTSSPGTDPPVVRSSRIGSAGDVLCVRNADVSVDCYFLERGNIGAVVSRLLPRQPALAGAVALRGVEGSMCAVREDRTVGCADFGPAVPEWSTFPGYSDLVDGAPDAGSLCALRASGRVVCSYGVIGRETAPSEVPGLTDAVDIDGTCAVRAGGSVVCWGLSPLGTVSLTPVPGITDAVRLTSGSGVVCALRRDRSVVCWGGNASGQLGGATTAESSDVPVSPVGLTDVVQIEATPYDDNSTHGRSVCALRGDGAVLCWGDFPYQSGRTGPPVVIEGLTGATAIASGNGWVCALDRVDALSCVGFGGRARLEGR